MSREEKKGLTQYQYEIWSNPSDREREGGGARGELQIERRVSDREREKRVTDKERGNLERERKERLD